jgi:hypothetical protein
MTIDSPTLASVAASLTAVSARERRTASKQKVPEKHLSIFLVFYDVLNKTIEEKATYKQTPKANISLSTPCPF